jgi:hypothetical protein
MARSERNSRPARTPTGSGAHQQPRRGMACAGSCSVLQRMADVCLQQLHRTFASEARLAATVRAINEAASYTGALSPQQLAAIDSYDERVRSETRRSSCQRLMGGCADRFRRRCASRIRQPKWT